MIDMITRSNLGEVEEEWAWWGGWRRWRWRW